MAPPHLTSSTKPITSLDHSQLILSTSADHRRWFTGRRRTARGGGCGGSCQCRDQGGRSSRRRRRRRRWCGCRATRGRRRGSSGAASARRTTPRLPPCFYSPASSARRPSLSLISYLDITLSLSLSLWSSWLINQSVNHTWRLLYSLVWSSQLVIL